MPILDDIKALCDRIAPLGWKDYLLSVTGNKLDIQQPGGAALAAELSKALPVINRTLPGMEDFAPLGQQAVTPAHPSLSLLYHVLASPLVARDHRGNPFAGFATPAELDLLENYIFSVAHSTLAEIIAAAGGASKVALVVYSSEYRPAADTVDGRHADLTFSRTGIARVGTARPLYLPDSRGFWPEDLDNAANIRVVPAKFSLWIAAKKKGADARISPLLDNDSAAPGSDTQKDFWIPVHKLFPGTECLSGLNLALSSEAKLFNLKIQKVHVFLETDPLPQGYPYVISGEDIAEFSSDATLGPGWLTPKVHDALVKPAMLDGRPVTFEVTPNLVDVFAAFSPASTGIPEYVHARTRVTDDNTFEDLNDEANVISEMKKGPYKALHYVDFTGEGWVRFNVTGLPTPVPSQLAAYALVSAPDFFPASGQFELSEWSRSASIPESFRDSLWSIPPTPLSEVRMPANLKLPGSPFKKADITVSAVVGMGSPTGTPPVWPIQTDTLRASSLPDDAAGVFAPGWDVGTDQQGGTTHLAAYALGSPFPEDAKLCAALSTFWPAVAPDVFRTFVKLSGRTNGTIAPLTDAEIGQAGSQPWDGIPGPRVIEEGGQQFVEFSSFLNADYVHQSLQNRFSMRLTARLTAEGYQNRILAACRVYSVLANLGNLAAARNAWLMLSFKEVDVADPSLQTAQSQASHVLNGPVYGMRMCRIVPSAVVSVSSRISRMPLVQPADFYATPGDVMLLAKRSGDLRFSRTRSER